MRSRLLVTVCVFALPATSQGSVLAEPPANQAFYDSWAQSDLPVAELRVSRTWMWGPDAFTPGIMEPYADSPGGEREVQYFDKTRKEINDPHGDRSSPWYVTNGLLAMELITGQLQSGDTHFESHPPAQVQVTGDQHPDSPTYAMLQPLLGQNPDTPGTVLSQRLSSDGSVSTDSAMAGFGVNSEYYVSRTDHTVASVFWSFMNSSGGDLSRRQLSDRGALSKPVLRCWLSDHRSVLGTCAGRRCPQGRPGSMFRAALPDIYTRQPARLAG